MMIQLRRILIAAVVCAAVTVPSVAADPAAAKLLAQGRVDDAIWLLRSETHTSATDAESYSLLCRAYYMLGEWNKSIAACEKAVSLGPDNSEYHSWLGRAYGEKASHSSFITGARLAGKVRGEFETAVRLSPASVDARSDLADFYVEAPGVVGGGKDKAEAQADQIAKLEPAEGYRVLARIAEQEKNYSTAETDYRTAIRLSGGKPGTWLNLARFYQHRGRLDEMEDAIRHATAPEMNRPDLLLDAAQMLIDTKRNIPEAADLLNRYLASRATVEDAPVFKAHYLLGTILEGEGNDRAAAGEYRMALSLARSYSAAQDALNRIELQTSEIN